MKAVVLHEYGDPDQLKYEDAADPSPGGDEIVIRAAAASINPVDYKLRSGALKQYMPLELPAILGRDVSGTVQSVGSKVVGFEVGQPVMALTNATYAELVRVKAAEVTHIPDGMSVVDAAALPLVVVTGDQVVREACQLKQGQTVLIAGALGSVGRCAVHSAKKLGAKVIAGVRRLQMDEARELGADEVAAIETEADIANLPPLDAVADMVGGSTAAALLGKVQAGGVFGSVLGPPANAKDHPDVRVAAIRAHPDPSKVREFADDVRDGKFRLPIDRTFPLAEAAEAQTYAEKEAKGKVLLLMF